MMNGEGKPGDKDAFHAFVVKETAKVYLLLDFLCGRADRRISDEQITVTLPRNRCQTVKNDGSVTQDSIVKESLITAVSKVNWPSAHDVLAEQQGSVAVLLRARDRLSEIAAPASDASIAFTTMVIKAGVKNQFWEFLKKNTHNNFIFKRDSLEKNNLESNKTQIDLAFIAYPHYWPLAINFECFRQSVYFFTIFFLFFAIILSCVAVILDQSLSFHSESSPFTGISCCVTINTLLKNYILPPIYGFLGANVCVARMIYNRTRDASLRPRDLPQMKTQRLLGVVIGSTIGLFSSQLSINNYGLSLSAVSFLAGLGVESVIRWLEGMAAALFADHNARGNSTPLQRN